jgi:hypothetical protein
LLLCACAWLAWLGLAPEGDGARSAVGIIALGTLAVLTRYDSVLFVAPLAFANLWRHRRDARVVATAVVGTLVVTAWLAFTRLYYGDLLPTSFYVKLPEDAALGNLGRGAFYAASFVVLSIAVPVALVRIGARRSDRDAHEAPRHMPIALAAGLVAEMAYAIVAGDTHMMYAYRLFVPYLPCVVLLVTARRGAAKAARGWLAAAGVLACLLYQVLLGACLYYLSENPNLSLLFRRQQIGDELYEFSTVGARHTRPFLGAVRESAREVEAHWRTTAASKSRPMRIAVHTGGMLPYALPEAYALELLVSYRHRCRPDLASFADYAQAVQNADAPSSPDRLFGTEGAGWQLIDKREFTIDGWQRKPYRIRVDMWYQPRPAAPTLPTTIDGPCLGG